MKNGLLAALAVVTLTAPVTIDSAQAQRHDDRDYSWNGDRDGDWNPADHYRNGNYRERRLGRNDRIYRGQDGRTYCRRNDGTTGLVVGAVGGGVLGNLVGGGTLGTLLGAGGGALLGRSVDRGNVRCR
ncbi:glycine zipper 2TM domain-containing protein [Sphingomonas sp. MA1305]|uniref:glycine zipper 2TM domain-containing protein n=1 Tax=unclassified Sphingomonas TaxID=196159 RepID=UPI0018DF7A20|nr:glycine zipper 2TM domain-containing protein [Sphingomonas sp. MA1305]MBI0476659.1 glycine zipper 2TM domain-containing protein [Sphingomonas sp. MA1305]